MRYPKAYGVNESTVRNDLISLLSSPKGLKRVYTRHVFIIVLVCWSCIVRDGGANPR